MLDACQSTIPMFDSVKHDRNLWRWKAAGYDNWLMDTNIMMEWIDRLVNQMMTLKAEQRVWTFSWGRCFYFSPFLDSCCFWSLWLCFCWSFIKSWGLPCARTVHYTLFLMYYSFYELFVTLFLLISHCIERISLFHLAVFDLCGCIFCDIHNWFRSLWMPAHLSLSPEYDWKHSEWCYWVLDSQSKEACSWSYFLPWFCQLTNFRLCLLYWSLEKRVLVVKAVTG